MWATALFFSAAPRLAVSVGASARARLSPRHPVPLRAEQGPEPLGEARAGAADVARGVDVRHRGLQASAMGDDVKVFSPVNPQCLSVSMSLLPKKPRHRG